jgi:hypothetical protein
VVCADSRRVVSFIDARSIDRPNAPFACSVDPFGASRGTVDRLDIRPATNETDSDSVCRCASIVVIGIEVVGPTLIALDHATFGNAAKRSIATRDEVA